MTSSGFAASRYRDQRSLNRAVWEAVEFVHANGWGARPALFALVPTELLADISDEFGGIDDSAPLTVISQEELPEGIEAATPELGDFLTRTSWPQGVVGAVLVQEIQIADTADSAATSSSTRTARLITGVIDDGPTATFLQVQPTEAELEAAGPFAQDDIQLRGGIEEAGGAELAASVISALMATFNPDEMPED
ncbi:PPA1309 family protein [Corynebacterium ulceribovis]|uniref:PPA1309 family protein n=1 Tax=Corynebacterium ulceribovis TaxID=487732 RepID=UPI0003764071|nr:PPA1309 family protein [Corynebacterium ulceribovis]